MPLEGEGCSDGHDKYQEDDDDDDTDGTHQPPHHRFIDGQPATVVEGKSSDVGRSTRWMLDMNYYGVCIYLWDIQ